MTIPIRHLDSWPFAPFEHTRDTFSTKNPGLSAVIAAGPTGRCCSNRDFRLPGRWRALSCLRVPLVNRIRHLALAPVTPGGHRQLCEPASTPASLPQPSTFSRANPRPRPRLHRPSRGGHCQLCESPHRHPCPRRFPASRRQLRAPPLRHVPLGHGTAPPLVRGESRIAAASGSPV